MRYEQEFSVRKTLYKDNTHKKISGVCSGLAKHYSVPRLAVRIGAVVSLFMFPVVSSVAYIVAALLMPNKYS